MQHFKCKWNFVKNTPFLKPNLKVSKGAKIRNRYNQVPQLTHNTNGKVTNSQLDTTNDNLFNQTPQHHHFCKFNSPLMLQKSLGYDIKKSKDFTQFQKKFVFFKKIKNYKI